MLAEINSFKLLNQNFFAHGHFQIANHKKCEEFKRIQMMHFILQRLVLNELLWNWLS